MRLNNFLLTIVLVISSTTLRADCVNCGPSIKSTTPDIPQAVRSYVKESIPEMAASINNCTPRPPKDRDTSKELPFRNKQRFIAKVCNFTQNGMMKNFYLHLKEELTHIKKKTGYCYTLKDPEIYNIIKCPNAGYDFNLMWHAAYHKARLMIISMVKKQNIDINQETGGYTVHDFISRQSEMMEYRINKLDKNARGYAKKRKLYLDMWQSWCTLQYDLSKSGAMPGKNSKYRSKEQKTCPIKV